MAGPSTKKWYCKRCGKRLRLYEDLGSAFCGDCAPMQIREIREHFRPRRGDPGRREAPPGGSPE